MTYPLSTFALTPAPVDKGGGCDGLRVMVSSPDGDWSDGPAVEKIFFA